MLYRELVFFGGDGRHALKSLGRLFDYPVHVGEQEELVHQCARSLFDGLHGGKAAVGPDFDYEFLEVGEAGSLAHADLFHVVVHLG